VNSSELQNTHMLESTRGTKLDPPSESGTVLPRKKLEKAVACFR